MGSVGADLFAEISPERHDFAITEKGEPADQSMLRWALVSSGVETSCEACNVEV